MNKAILVLNSGSSSIKFALFQIKRDKTLPVLFRGQIDGINGKPRFSASNASGQRIVNDLLERRSNDPYQDALQFLLSWVKSQGKAFEIISVGHRVVHGGNQFATPVLIDDQTLLELEKFIPLAPLHQPHNLAAIKAIQVLYPQLPQVACFDTAFHRTQPWLAQAFALPESVTRYGIKRYGFHGLSYEYIASVLPNYLGKKKALGRIVVAHLGNGASLCAIKEGKSVASTMGFSTLDGLMMGTRCGALDPGVVLYLMQEKNYDVMKLTRLLYHESGLLGVSGISGDMRELIDSEDEQAYAAIDLFIYRIARELGSMVAALGGIDALVFTAGIGEHAIEVRGQICKQAQWLGIELNEKANSAGKAYISMKKSKVSVWVIPTDEEWMIARHCIDFC